MVWTFEGIVEACVLGGLLFAALCCFIYGIAQYYIHKWFYKDCTLCEHCKLTNVASCGGSSYSCYRDDKHRVNLTPHHMISCNASIWKRCKHYTRKVYKG